MESIGRRQRLAAIVSVGFAALCAPAGSWAQSPSPQTPVEPTQVFRGTTTLIPVDVRVVDRAGKPVTDLLPDDFVITENGVRQAIRHFSAQSYTPAEPSLADALKARTAQTESIEPQNRRVFVIVLGRGRLQPPGEGVHGATHLVRDRLLPQDLVAVIAWNRATEFTTAHAKIVDLLGRFKKAHEKIEGRLAFAMSGLAAVYGSKEIPKDVQNEIDAVFGGPANGLGARTTEPTEGANATRMAADRQRIVDQLADSVRSEPSGGADLLLEDFVASRAKTTQDLGNLYAGVEYLRRFEGEKHLIFVTEHGLVLPRAEDDKDLAAIAADARVVMHFVHTGGVQLVGPFDITGYSASRSGLAGGPRPVSQLAWNPMGWQMSTSRTVASLTGGRLYAGRYAKEAVDDIDRMTRFTYLLGYYPSNPNLDAKYRQIRVSVNRPGLFPVYRHGYYATAPIGPVDRREMLTYSRVITAAGYPRPVPDIGIRATATASKPPAAAEIWIDMTVDASRLGFAKADGRNAADLELLVGCLDGRDNLLGQAWKHVELRFTDDRLEAVRRTGVPISMSLPIGGAVAAAKNVKIVAYDYAADLVGTAIVKVR